MKIRNQSFLWGSRTYLMGVVNLTPDSFSDGGKWQELDAALAQVESMVPYIDILDVGGESTRPGAAPVASGEEMRRVLPLITKVRELYPDLPISIDTTKKTVAEAAIAAGADLVNDVSAGRFDLDMLAFVARYQIPIVLMHMQGQPRTMQANPQYQNVVQDVLKFLKNGASVAIAWGLAPDLIIVDPGIGFGKSLEHNLQLLRHLAQFQQINYPILVGVSRKSFIGELCNQPQPSDRLMGTAAACGLAIAQGADILRVHDAKAIKEVCLVADAIHRIAAMTT